MANLREEIQTKPLQAITVALAVIGVVFSVFNFYLLSNIAPIERRVAAIEERNAKADPLISEFIEQRGTIKAIEKDISEIKEDLRDVKNYLNIR